ncbi:thiol methyltransferase [Aspergillus luchuensis]|uniref:Thiol methyltransferase n=1 Tax=Aspergillus kawachii TaxID=1069201 RepID=A0A146FJP2_ASPKA|nr:thiol methyltransferase [Aspergillus luchuensis]
MNEHPPMLEQASWPEHPGTKVSYDAAGRWRWRPLFMNDATSIGLRGTTPGYSPARELPQMGMLGCLDAAWIWGEETDRQRGDIVGLM